MGIQGVVVFVFVFADGGWRLAGMSFGAIEVRELRGVFGKSGRSRGEERIWEEVWEDVGGSKF